MHLQGISRRFGHVDALKDVTFSLEQGELISFVGPSGAGKTSLLKILAGLDEPSSGTISRRRAVSRSHPAILVFQDYLLFPHMSVFDNVAFGLRSQARGTRLSRRGIHERVMEHLEQLGIAEKAHAWPAQLSGGQKQRVALARALVMEPGLLLLDEPFANLDKNLKRETARFIRALQRRLGITIVIVSHDLEEAAEVSDRIGVMIDGRLHQVDTFRRIYYHPVNLEVARLFGPVNVIPHHLHGIVAGRPPRAGEPSDLDVAMCARADTLEIVPCPDGIGEVLDIHLVGGTPHYTVKCAEWKALVRSSGTEFVPGSRVDIIAREVFAVDVGSEPVTER